MTTSRSLLRRVYNALPSAPLGGASLLAVQFPTELASKSIVIRTLRVKWQAGTAATNTLRVFEDSLATNEVDEFAAVAVADQIKSLWFDSYAARLDADAKLYLQPNPNAGVDNTYKYVIDYEECSTQVGEDQVN